MSDQTSTPPLSAVEYDRMHAVIHGVIDGDGRDPAMGCLFFALAGAYLLSELHDLPSAVHVGSAFYCVGGDPPNVLMFARLQDNHYVADQSMGRFHAWVECGGWVIDLMAPVRFHENAQRQRLTWAVPRRRFQKHIDTMAPTLNDIHLPGSFGVIPDEPLRDALMQPMTDAPNTMHMINQCVAWYRRPPVAIPAAITLPLLGGGTQIFKVPTHHAESDW